jgi:hypothetical protein
MGRYAPSFGRAPSDRHRLPLHTWPFLQLTAWPDLVPIQTGAPAQIRAAGRSPGTPAVLPSRCVASVDQTGLLRRSTRCSVITLQCAHVAVCMPDAGGEQSGHLAAPGRQTGKRSGEDTAKGLWHLISVRLVTGEPRRRLEHIVIFNNGSTTAGPNG